MFKIVRHYDSTTQTINPSIGKSLNDDQLQGLFKEHKINQVTDWRIFFQPKNIRERNSFLRIKLEDLAFTGQLTAENFKKKVDELKKEWEKTNTQLNEKDQLTAKNFKIKPETYRWLMTKPNGRNKKNANTIVQQDNTVENDTENKQSKNQSLSILFRRNFQ